MQLSRERHTKKHHAKILAVLLAVSISSISLANAAFADTSQTNFSRIDGENLQDNPTAASILKNIEIAKQRMEQLQEKQKERMQYENHLEEQREIAKSHLQKDLESMNKQYQDFTPRNSFGKFVSSYDSKYHGIYWDQFDYMDAKIQVATQARDNILEDGGSYVQAQKEFNKFATMPRVELISTIQDANIQNGFSDKETQTHFSLEGKLPRYEDDSLAPSCYGCKKYEIVKQAVLQDDDQKVKQLTDNFEINKISNSETKPENQETSDNKETNKDRRSNDLQTQLMDLKRKFMDENNLEEQKSIIKDMNSLVQKMQKKF